MAITLDDLTTDFSHVDRTTLVEDWCWLVGTTKLPIAVTAMGNLFLQDSEDGSVHLLDVAAGKLEPIADSPQGFQAMLGNSDFVMERFLVDEFVRAREALGPLDRHKVYGFKVPPVLGGSFDVDNLEATSAEVHFCVSGQVHQQVKDLQPGTPVPSIVLK